MKTYSVYLITNLINNKWYVGKTGNTVEKRWKEHKVDSKKSNKHLHNAIRKYGCENFDVQTLAVVSTEDEVNTLERVWILLLESYKPQFGYNMTLGGEGQRPNEETKKRISETKKNKKIKWSPERRLKRELPLPDSLIAEAYLSGFSLNEVSKKFGVTRETIQKRLARQGVTLRESPSKKKELKISIEELTHLFLVEKISISKLAKINDMYDASMRNRLEALGILKKREQQEKQVTTLSEIPI